EQYWNSPKVQAYFSAKDLEKTKLKKLVRAGVPDGLRGEIYAKILKLDQLAEYEKNYEVALTRTHGSVIPSEPLPPTFGGKSHAAQLALNKIGSRTTEHIRCIIAHDFPALEYCPFITPCVELLAHHMRDEDELLGAIYAMVKRSTQRSPTSTSQSASSSSSQQDEWGYFPTYRKGVKLMLRAFGNLLYTSNKRLHLHLTELHSTSPDPVWADWLTTMLIGHIPQPALWRLLDAFVLEGWKALFRFAAGMLMCQRDVLLAQPDLGHVNALLTPENPIFTPPTVLLKQAESITVSRSDVRKLKDHHKTLAAISHDDHISESQYRYQRGLPKLISSSTSTPTSSSVLTDEHWIALWSWIPPAKRVESLELVFTTKEHGTHSANLFRRCEGRAPMILVVETLKGEVFGAYLSARWPSGEEEGGRGEWFGNGETFLFSLVPYAKLYPWIGR
ncbi:uncharacterized protein EV422DRAFT_488951, partial [Fimicolochytrium jonesii]|uniref:uncharacterized protein n=1 Tax=Fimicolochytrium jonesii TaxID=1396493 RepID=UPI0022FE0F3C